MLRLTWIGLLVLSTGAAGCGDETGAGGTGGTMMFEPGPTCTAFCAKAIGECGAFTFDEASCRQGCEESLAEGLGLSDACGNAVESVFQCVSELDCPGVQSWREQEPLESYSCRSDVAIVDSTCPF